MGTHCGPWDRPLAYLMLWPLEVLVGTRNGMTGMETSLYTTLYNNSRALHPPLLVNIPLEICLHGSNAPDSVVIFTNHAIVH